MPLAHDEIHRLRVKAEEWLTIDTVNALETIFMKSRLSHS
jgi:hypothetical protein